MISNTNIVRESLAKLLSNENIRITHSANVSTAGFDVVNRELILPVWKDTDQSVYTLLITHEVGHALYSPSDELREALNENRRLKHILNIVEDVRIEKLIQKKYPGTKFHFRKGYLKLLKDNFFGTKDKTPDSYGLLDRLNIHFKVGTFDYYSVPFSEDELVWIDKISACDTFSDVFSVSKELLNFLDEQKSQDKNNENGDSNSQEESSDYNSSQSESDIDSSEYQDGKDSQEFDSNSSRTEEESELNSSGISEDSEINDLFDEYSCETQSSFDSSVKKNIVDEKIEHYIELQEFSESAFDQFLVNYRNIHNSIDLYYENLRNNSYYSKDFSRDAFITKVSEFKAKHSFSVNSMANLFEMKKRASLYSRSLTSKTGQLDMNRIHSYSYNDDIFKKITSIPEGKSHGIVMFFDMSSSMDRILSSCLEQILLVAMFCKKINIPFDVYGFSNNQQYYHNAKNTTVGDIKIDGDFTLRHYLSSRMTSHEYEHAFLNIIRLAEGHDYGAVPPSERLCATPLVPCILASKSIISRFRSSNSLDIVNALFITDGEDNHYVYDKNNIIDQHIHKGNIKCVIRTKAGKDHLVFDSYWSFRRHTSENLLKMVKSETGANMISFYLDSSIENACRKLSIPISEYSKVSLKKDGFLETKSHAGYDALYVIKTSRLKLDNSERYADAEYSDSEDIKTVKKNVRAIARKFNKYMNNSTHNKVFLNKFMEQIS